MKVFTPNRFFTSLILLLLLSLGATAQTPNVVLTSGSGTWRPAPGIRSFHVFTWGGGAGGSGSAGGGGGSFSRSTVFVVNQFSFNNGYAYTVGAGGGAGQDGQDTRFELCWAYRGLANGASPQRYTNPGIIDNSFFGGRGGNNFSTCCDNWGGGGGGSAFSNQGGSNGGNAALFSNGGGGNGTGNGASGGQNGGGGNGGVPGGGGGGNGGSGGRGEIRIFTVCDYTPGEIEGGYTTPFPAHMPAGSSFIRNKVSPDGFGLTVIWQDSSASTGRWRSITGATQLDYPFPALSQDTISEDTWYRRVVTNGCSANPASNISNVIPIRVFSLANGRLNGTISGKIVSRNRETGVPNILIRAQKTVSLLGSPQSRIDTVRTDADGNFTLINLYYGDVVTNDPASSVTFTVTPIKQGAGAVFQPANRTATLLNTNPNATLANITDTSVYIVRGRVTQSCPECLPGSTGPFGIPGARIGANVQGVIPALTDSLTAPNLGRYELVINDPGQYLLTPSYFNHRFNPASRDVVVTADVNGIDFSDTTTRLISGRLVDGAGRRIGSGRLLFEGVYLTRTGSEIVTFRRESIIATNDSTYSVRLPAGFQYRVSVASFTPAFPAGDDRHVREDSVRNFFTRWAPEPLIDIRQNDSVRNLVYRRPPVIVMLGLRDTACNTINPALNPGIVFRTNVRRFFEVYVFEGPPSLQQRVPVSSLNTRADTLQDYIRIYTSVHKRGATDGADTIYGRLKGNVGLLPMLDTSIFPGAPQITAPYRKPFELHYYDRFGRRATPLQPRTTVVGTFNPTRTFTTASPEKPFLILHSPPGDQSFSFWEKDTSYSLARSWSVGSSKATNGFANVSLGGAFSVSSGAVSFDVEVIATANYTHTNSVNHGTTDELVETVTTKQRFETSKSSLFVEGSSGDVYVGNAVNYLMGKSIFIDFKPETAPAGCEIQLDSALFLSVDSFLTEFAYAEDHILNVIIPQQQRLLAQATTFSDSSRFKRQISVWQQVIEQNNENKRLATAIKNRSFSSGAAIEESETISKSGSNTITYDVEVDNQIAFELGLRLAGRGATGGAVVTLQETWGNSTTNARGSETTMGYRLQDDDPGDFYSVDIKRDPIYGTPVFELVAGTSSCPPEAGAQRRDLPQILSGDMRIENIDPNQTRFFDITLVNRSESDELRPYELSVDAGTSEGLVISSSQSANLVSHPVVFFVPPGGTQNVRIRVDKFDRNDKILSYPDVEFYLTDVCGLDGIFIPNDINTAKISFDFLSACGGIDMTAPQQGWLVTPSSGNLLPITMAGYTLANIDSVSLQYKLQGSSSWLTGFTLRQANISGTSFTQNWSLASVADGDYSIRLRLVCRNGDIILSNITAGRIDRSAPVLVGRPLPGNGLYTPGGEISFTYSEFISRTNLNSTAVSMVRIRAGVVTTIPVTVTEFEGKVFVVPSVDLGSQPDSFRVIVRNITDLAGNVRATADTVFFRLTTQVLQPYTGPNIATVSVSQPSISNGSTGRIELRFRLRERTRKVTRVFFNLAGVAIQNADYRLTYDTIKQRRCLNGACTNSLLLPVLNDFNAAPAYVNIDSNQQEVVVFLTPVQQSFTSGSRSVIVNLLPGATYRTGVDSASATATILAVATPVLYVNAQATGTGSGLSWQNAFTRLELALNSTQPGVSQVWVARGTYRPTANTNRDSAFVMRNNLAIYGGFAGGETTLSQRNWRVNPTILSGDIGVVGNRADNSFNVVRNNNNALNSTAVLDGFTITGGNANKGEYVGNRGGGIFNRLSSPTIANCILTGNNAVEYGGAVFNEGASTQIVNTVLAGNTAAFGGGAYNESSTPVFINCTFAGNQVTGIGGGFYSFGSPVATIRNSILWGNTSSIGVNASVPAVSNSIVQGGYAAGTNISTADPVFMIQPAIGLANLGDLRLQACSPAINAGVNAVLPAAFSNSDLAGANRIVGANVDMGAYERQALALPTTIYVDANATGANDGTSWANAYTTLQAALSDLNLCAIGSAPTVLVARGTYQSPSAGALWRVDKVGAVILGGYPNGGGVTRNVIANPVVFRGEFRVLKNARLDGVRIEPF